MDENVTSPLVVSPAARRVAAAAVTVIAERGLDELSVRSVGARLGMSGGAVQHHFPSRAKLLSAAMASVIASMTERLTPIIEATRPPTGRATLDTLLREALPLDDVRRAEGSVWMALSTAAAVHPELREQHSLYLDTFVDGLAALLSAINPSLGGTGHARARALAATVDGLTLQGIAGSLTPEAMTTTLSRAIADALTPR
ncbi:TetR/AcrR family transcriptional regulator [Amycolatopsis sp. NPDC004625]|uniref:TetR/AcrR family transcriptional regulator n=1 Tax=Amycolatopsis sp. NPDC004625 TaxID=3154670 RepID=UPI0033B8B6F0